MSSYSTLRSVRPKEAVVGPLALMLFGAFPAMDGERYSIWCLLAWILTATSLFVAFDDLRFAGIMMAVSYTIAFVGMMEAKKFTREEHAE